MGSARRYKNFLEVRGEEGEALLARMFRDSRLFRLIMDEVEKTLLFVDLDIAGAYAGLVAEPQVRDTIFAMIEREYRLTAEMVRKVSGEAAIGERFPRHREASGRAAPHDQRGQSRAGRAVAPVPRRPTRPSGNATSRPYCFPSIALPPALAPRVNS